MKKQVKIQSDTLHKYASTTNEMKYGGINVNFVMPDIYQERLHAQLTKMKSRETDVSLQITKWGHQKYLPWTLVSTIFLKPGKNCSKILELGKSAIPH